MGNTRADWPFESGIHNTVGKKRFIMDWMASRKRRPGKPDGIVYKTLLTYISPGSSSYDPYYKAQVVAHYPEPYRTNRKPSGRARRATR